ncbi:ImcF-related family protein [Inquilinus sp. Marseille-Q2685]|uniref:ImcF-related family protein n=1 Tax=Inquilinus sp. Marseille-Q2685 TaxID=2866581 RepID=UPI001CE45CB3|nr:ImcF-related family protein [Inquilinus sp. Marseille-Q2685]
MDTRRRLTRLVGCVLAAAVLAGLAAIHVSNHRLADRARAAIERAQAATPAPGAAPEDPAAALPALDALTASPLAAPGPLPWWRQLSLNAAPLEDLSAATAGLDRELLRDAFLRRLAQRILARIDRPDIASDLAFDGLKAALAIGGAGPRQDGLIRLWASTDWSLTAPDALRQPLLGLLDRALATEPRLAAPTDMTVVERIRARLRSEPLSARAYAAIRTSDAAQNLLPFRADLVLGADSWAVRRRSGASLSMPIPGLLTADGFHQVVVPALTDLSVSLDSDDWVLGAAPAESGDLTASVLALYLDDVARAWDGLQDDLELTPADDPDAAARIIAVLTRSPSPLLRLAVAARRATRFDRGQGDDAALAALARKLGGLRLWTAIDRRYAWLDGAEPQGAPSFDAIRRFVATAGSMPADAAAPAPALD